MERLRERLGNKEMVGEQAFIVVCWFDSMVAHVHRIGLTETLCSNNKVMPHVHEALLLDRVPQRAACALMQAAITEAAIAAKAGPARRNARHSIIRHRAGTNASSLKLTIRPTAVNLNMTTTAAHSRLSSSQRAPSTKQPAARSR